MQFKIKNIKIKISFTFFALILILIAFERTEYLLVSLVSAVLHEAGHLIALIRFKTEIVEFKISVFGANIKTNAKNQMNYFKDFLISFSGPLVNFVISFVAFIIYNLYSEKIQRSLLVVEA